MLSDNITPQSSTATATAPNTNVGVTDGPSDHGPGSGTTGKCHKQLLAASKFY